MRKRWWPLWALLVATGPAGSQPSPGATGRFAAWLKKASHPPPEIAVPRVLFGKPFMKKSVFVPAPGPGRVSQISGIQPILIVGRQAAFTCDPAGKQINRVEFEHPGNNMHAIDIDDDGVAEYIDAGNGFGPVALFDMRGKQRWSLSALTIPQLIAVGDFDGNGRLQFAVAGTAAGKIELFDLAGKPTGAIVADNVQRLWAPDTDGDGKSEIAWVNRQGQLTIGGPGQSKNQVHNLDKHARRATLVGHSAGEKPGLLYVRQTSARLVGFDGRPRAAYDLPLANAGWVKGVIATPVKLRADRPDYIALAVRLRSLWRRSLLVLTTPEGRTVYEEILKGDIGALGTAPAELAGEQLLLVGDDNRVLAYGFDRDFYRTAYKRVIDVFRGNPNAENLLPVKPANTAREVRDGWWKWTIFIEGPPAALDQIACVEYRLHPSFENPIRLVCRRGLGHQAFSLNMGGWGTFIIRVRMFLRDGPVQEMTHKLRLWHE